MQLPTNLDSDGEIISFIIYTIRDLRNAIAHNSVVFDTRFQTAKINKRLISLLQIQTGISNIDFKYISSYIILVTYLLRKMGVSKKECTAFMHQYLEACKHLYTLLPNNVYFEILGKNNRSIMSQLEIYIKK